MLLQNFLNSGLNPASSDGSKKDDLGQSSMHRNNQSGLLEAQSSFQFNLNKNLVKQYNKGISSPNLSDAIQAPQVNQTNISDAIRQQLATDTLPDGNTDLNLLLTNQTTPEVVLPDAAIRGTFPENSGKELPPVAPGQVLKQQDKTSSKEQILTMAVALAKPSEQQPEEPVNSAELSEDQVTSILAEKSQAGSSKQPLQNESSKPLTRQELPVELSDMVPTYQTLTDESDNEVEVSHITESTDKPTVDLFAGQQVSQAVDDKQTKAPADASEKKAVNNSELSIDASIVNKPVTDKASPEAVGKADVEKPVPAEALIAQQLSPATIKPQSEQPTKDNIKADKKPLPVGVTLTNSQHQNLQSDKPDKLSMHDFTASKSDKVAEQSAQKAVPMPESKMMDKAFAPVSEMKSPELTVKRSAAMKLDNWQMSLNQLNTLASFNASLASRPDAATATPGLYQATAVDAPTQAGQPGLLARDVALPVALPRTQWNQRFAEHVSMLALKGASHARIRLDPPELGPMTVRIQQQGAETQIHFTVNNPVARELVDSGMQRLRDMLEQHGFANVNVDVNEYRQGKQQSSESDDLDESDQQFLAGQSNEPTEMKQSIATYEAGIGIIDIFA